MVKSKVCEQGRYGLNLSLPFIGSVALSKFLNIFKMGAIKIPTMKCCCKD